MKNYLDLVKISSKVHKKQNRMSVFCIFLAVFLVTTIFGMADMFIQSQFIQAQMEDGLWHIGLRYISDEEAALIRARPEVRNFACYGVLNYGLNMGYTMNGKELIVCGSDESYLTEMELDAIVEGTFPQTEQEAIIGENAKQLLHLEIGDSITISSPDGTEFHYTISGFARNVARVLREDVCYVFLTTPAFRTIFPNPVNEDAAGYDSMYFVRFANHRNIRETVKDIKAQFSLSDEQVTENAKVLALLGQSGNTFIMQIYITAGVLAFLVMFAGILMISGSLNSNVAGRTRFFGMIRCIGATPKQTMRIVRKEAFHWCRFAVPAAIASSALVIWILCAVLRALSPKYFAALPVFGISIPSIIAGVCVSVLTVLLAARSPAKRAARVSPLTAVTGHANDLAPARKAADTRFLKIDTALGIHHAKASRKNFILIVGSFSLSIILFLGFSVTLDFMNHAINPLEPWTPDLSIISPDNTCSVDASLLTSLRDNPVVKRAYGRKFACDVPVTINGEAKSVMLISYDDIQFAWAKKYEITGSVEEARDKTDTALLVFSTQNGIQAAAHDGDIVSFKSDCQNSEATSEITIVGTVSECPFNSSNGSEILLCSEETFERITGQNDSAYTIIDIQLTRDATDYDASVIRELAGENYNFSDNRMSNESVRGAYYSFGLFLYGFLILIGLITVFNIINCMAMNVAARMKEFGALRAIGLTNRQLKKMIIVEASAYAAAGSVLGSALGLTINKLLFDKLVTFRWGETWSVPYEELGVILLIVAFSVTLAVWNPLRKVQEMSIVDTIGAE